MRDPRLKKLAEILVNYSVEVKPGQLVRIRGGPIAQPLVLEIYRQVLAAGAHPFIDMQPEETSEILYKEGSDQQISFLDPLALNEIEKIDCSISLWAEENTRLLTNCDPKKMSLGQAARKPIMDIFMKRSAEKKLRWVGTQFPTSAAAQDAEMSLADYENFVFGAGLLEMPNPVAGWRQLSERQQRLADFLNGKSDYHVKTDAGTDVRMSLAAHKWINCDGHYNFPDGEVFSGPVLDSVNGTIAFSFPAVHGGREVLGARLTFRDGKVVDASAAKGEDFLISMLDMDAGSRYLGECAIGTNYSIQQFTRNTLFDEKIGGTVHFALGAGYPETGNSNESGLHWDMVVDLRTGGFLEIDGQRFSIDGKFTREGFPTPAPASSAT